MRVSYWSQDRDNERSREADDLFPNLRETGIRGKEKSDATQGVVKGSFPSKCSPEAASANGRDEGIE